MYSVGSKKNNNTRYVGQKSVANSFLGVKSLNKIKTSKKNHNLPSITPYDQYSNSNEVLYHPLGLKKQTVPNKINTLERRSK